MGSAFVKLVEEKGKDSLSDIYELTTLLKEALI
ncbi:hypothetical protein N752_27690 [Desulforamulus aquiferis]|nr:hypothetical protein N752_27690 [Desulforamulus aquiferis]